MLRSNITVADFSGGVTRITTAKRWQYDYGQLLSFSGIELPPTFECQFSNIERGEAITQIGSNNTVTIPDAMFLRGAHIYAWVFLHTGENDGETEYMAVIPIMKRAQPSDTPPTPVEQSVITQAIAALNAAVDQTGADVIAAEAAQAAAELAQEKAEDAKTAAETAQGKAEEAQTAAEAAATGVESDALKAEGYAVGQQKGSDVGSGSPYYHNNAKYYNEQAASSATAASDAQTAAETAQGKAEDAQAAAETAQGKAEDAQSAAEAAQTAAETAQGKAEDAQSAAEAAQAAAETAQGKAEDAQAAAEAAVIDKADIIISSASGTIASFADGAALPVVDLTVDIDPIQDLHGYDAPWPAGGGKNKLPNAAEETQTNAGITVKSFGDGQYTINGTDISGSANRFTFDLVEQFTAANTQKLVLGGNWIGTIRFLTSGGVQIDYWSKGDSNERIISSLGNLVGNSVAKIRFDLVANSAHNNETAFFMLVDSSVTDTSFTPYSNICPISGRTRLELYRTGKNMLSYTPTWLNYSALGVVLDKTKATFLKGNTQYIFSFDMENATSWRIAAVVFDENGNRLFDSNTYYLGSSLRPNESGQYYVWGGNKSDKQTAITTIQDCYVMLFFNLGDVSASTVMTSPMLELDSTATTYPPYQGNVYTFDWSSTAGTVYAGSINPVTGVLKSRPYIASYNGETLVGPWISSTDGYAAGATPTTGAQVVDMGGTETSYQLTEQEVAVLTGANNIWANSGDVSVSYRADTKLYIDNKIAQAIAAALNA